jgi:uncharacterized membrane protein (UPF0127 family)
MFIMKIIHVENKNNPLQLPLSAIFCDSFLCRLHGLMFRSRLEMEKGLLLVEPRENRLEAAIHMLFVFMDLAIIWLNADQTVVDTVLARTWHPAYTPQQPARFILEVHPDRLNEFKIGDHVEFHHE